ncbi:MAG: glycosyltransferase, partial [Prevotella sp.]|nr:glycosyltransferase [Prevotella sp.]
MKQASFSIIIPIYNVEKYIARALDSVLAQNYDNMEILCMDDKSPDSSADIICKYTAHDARIKLIKGDANIGLGAVRNRGMRLAKNDWVLFLDSDDWYETGLLHKLNVIIQNNPNINIIEFQFNLAYPIEQTNKCLQAGWLNRGESGLRKTESENIVLTVYVWNKCWRHSFLIENNLENN